MANEEITNSTPISQMTAGQLAAFLKEHAAAAGSEAQAPAQAPRLVYGLKGIMDLFQVSNMTAQRYKKGIIKAAVSQYGRKIITNADLALQLYKEAKEKEAQGAE